MLAFPSQLLACCPETLSAAVSLARVQEEALTVPKAQSVVAAGEQVLAATKNEPDASRALKVDRLLALCEADGITDAVIDARARAGVCLWCDQPRLRKPRPAVAAPGDRMARLEDEVDAINRILRAPYGGMAMLPSRARDEVAPRLYLSEESWVLDRAALRTEGVTHILNCAEGTDRRQVGTGPGQSAIHACVCACAQATLLSLAEYLRVFCCCTTVHHHMASVPVGVGGGGGTVASAVCLKVPVDCIEPLALPAARSGEHRG